LTVAQMAGKGCHPTCAGLKCRRTRPFADGANPWTCTRNDVLGQPAVLLAALGVFGTGKVGRISPSLASNENTGGRIGGMD